MKSIRVQLLLLFLIGFLCPAVGSAQQQRMSAEELERAEAMASSVTIYRDRFGVPHVYGPTDASVVFGFTWARAEDEFARMQQSLLTGAGRLSELMGSAGISFRIER